jgi:hypothetical protein
VVFVTEREFPPNGGLAAADALCNDEAKDFLTGTFVAYLSTDSESALARIGDGPWYTGTTLLGTKDDLAHDALKTSILSMTGKSPGKGTQVWTGTVSGGAASTTAAATCRSWTSNAPTDEATIGQLDYPNAGWTANDTVTCQGSHSVYCFEK